MVAQAVQCHGSGATGEAERLYNQALTVSPSHPVANYNLALLLIEQGRFKAARLRLLALLKAAPQDAAAHYTLGKVFRAENEPLKSLFHLRRALDLAPDRLETHIELIEAYGRLARLDDARQAATAARARFPGQADIPAKLGLVLLRAGLPDEARPLLLAALEAKPDHVLALYNLAKLTDEQGDPGAALDLYRSARTIDPAFEPTANKRNEL